MNKEKKRHLVNLYSIAQKYPEKRTRVLAMLDKHGLTINDWESYDSLMVSHHVVEPDSIVDKYPDIEGFTQTDKMSDNRILQIFQDKDELLERKEEIGVPPTDADWYKAGLDAEQRIEKLTDPYKVLQAEEWEGLESPLAIPEDMRDDFPFAFLSDWFGGILGGATGLAWNTLFGPLDLTTDFKDVSAHERGFGTSYNPLTGFGAWDLAEQRVNPETGQWGFSPELLKMEEELDDLYGTKRNYQEQIREGDYKEVGGINTEIEALNKIINENLLKDPR